MFTVLYGICSIITVIVLIYLAQKNYYTIDIYQWTILLLVPIIVTAYWLKTMVTTAESAGFLYCFIYLDSTVLVVVAIFSLYHTIGIEVHSWLKIFIYGIASIHLAIVCFCVHNNLYYRSITVVEHGADHATITQYGPLIPLHFAFLGLLALWLLGVIIVGFKRSGAYSKRNLYPYTIALVAAMGIYAVETLVDTHFPSLPFLYTAASVYIGLNYERSHKHDLSLIIADHQKNHRTRGYMAMDSNMNFLVCNEKCSDFVPFLKDQRVNQKLPKEDEICTSIYKLAEDFERDSKINTRRFTLGGMACDCEISNFSIRSDGKKQGYLLEFRDATEAQRAYDIINSYNETLNAEVIEKTNSISDIQQRIVLGMADMIENRDNNTGGHVKRTSDIIRIIVDEIIRQGIIPMTDQMARDIVRAAPTHDLGKISIDSSILNKPGRLTDEEFTIMKTHSSKSGEMVKILLEGVEEDRFVTVAFNVARYHHERWDGRGYPEGLVGSMIPLEARIMAIADVYDALVSKRVYKEPMSFEKSAEIMCECMGTQFDPNMERVFLGCQSQLEDYYAANS